MKKEQPKEEETVIEEDEEKVSSRVNESIDRANAAAARQEAANERHEKLIQRQEALRVEDALSGQAAVEPVKKEESPSEYMKKVLSGDFNVKGN